MPRTPRTEGGNGGGKIPPRPYSEWLIFYQLERNYILQRDLKVNPATYVRYEFDPLKDGFFPSNLPLPKRYAGITLPGFWYTNLKDRKWNIKCKDVAAKELTERVKNNWENADTETKMFVQTLHQIELGQYQRLRAEYDQAHGKSNDEKSNVDTGEAKAPWWGSGGADAAAEGKGEGKENSEPSDHSGNDSPTLISEASKSTNGAVDAPKRLASELNEEQGGCDEKRQKTLSAPSHNYNPQPPSPNGDAAAPIGSVRPTHSMAPQLDQLLRNAEMALNQGSLPGGYPGVVNNPAPSLANNAAPSLANNAGPAPALRPPLQSPLTAVNNTAPAPAFPLRSLSLQAYLAAAAAERAAAERQTVSRVPEPIANTSTEAHTAGGYLNGNQRDGGFAGTTNLYGQQSSALQNRLALLQQHFNNGGAALSHSNSQSFPPTSQGAPGADPAMIDRCQDNYRRLSTDSMTAPTSTATRAASGSSIDSLGSANGCQVRGTNEAIRQVQDDMSLTAAEVRLLLLKGAKSIAEDAAKSLERGLPHPCPLETKAAMKYLKGIKSGRPRSVDDAERREAPRADQPRGGPKSNLATIAAAATAAGIQLMPPSKDGSGGEMVGGRHVSGHNNEPKEPKAPSPTLTGLNRLGSNPASGSAFEMQQNLLIEAMMKKKQLEDIIKATSGARNADQLSALATTMANRERNTAAGRVEESTERITPGNIAGRGQSPSHQALLRMLLGADIDELQATKNLFR